MKRSKIVVFLCLYFTVSVFAQPVLEGLKLGYNAVNVKCQETEIKSRASMLAGVFFQWPIQENLYLQPEILYYQRYYDLHPDGSQQLGITLEYLQVPILIRKDVTPFTVFRIGPVVGFKPTVNEDVSPRLLNSDEKYFDNFDFILRCDLAMCFHLFKRKFEIGASYHHGLQSFSTDKMSRQYERSISVSLGFYFSHKITKNDFPAIRQQAVDELSYILSSDEAENMLQAQDSTQLKELVDGFWSKNDTTPGTPENEYRDEYEQRIKSLHAMNIHPRSDRGRVLLLFGPPDDIIHEPYTAIMLGMTQTIHSIEIWLYDEPAGPNRVPDLFLLQYPGQKKYIFADFGYNDYTKIFSTEPGEVVDPRLFGR
ncbi:GWxTD domain-containing protein [candidate division KSB1 bacterium]|nr:GWxTD domain-containing protein [candidate division KSB1 bacterium]